MSNRDLSFPLLEHSLDRLVVLTSATSTNSEVKAFLNDRNVVAVVTDNQTDGRGRLGRAWVAKLGESIALSVALPWSSGDQESSGLWVPLIAGASLVGVLQHHRLAEASLKWPNDVVVGEKKLAGILCEFVPSGWVIVGVGLNIDFPVGAPPSPRATGLFHHVSAVEGLVDSVLAGFVTELRDWVDDVRTRLSHDNVGRVSSVMGTLGRSVEVQEASGDTWRGEAQGLDHAGHLLVMPEGLSELRAVVASDIEHLYQ